MAALLTPDPAVPQRDVLLDGEQMARRMSSCMGVAIDRCEPVRARYQVGRSLRVLYRASNRGAAHFVALRTFPGARGEEVFQRAREGAWASGSLPGVAHDPELGAVLFTFPNDRKVAGLRALVGGGRLVAYAPEKCATVRLRGAYAKAYAGDEGDRTRRIHDCLHSPASDAGLRLPRAGRYSETERTLVCEAIDGRPLAELHGGERARGVHRLGAALAILHGLEPPAEAPAFERLDAFHLHDAAETIGHARPECAAAARELGEQLLARAPAEADRVCLHGDVHPKNAIIADGNAALIDLDQVSTGVAAADVGSMLAALRYGRLVGAHTAAEERTQAEAFLAGYACVRRPPDAATLAWHLSAALLAERALRTVTRVRTSGLARLPDILTDARATLERRP
jgi:aminoglycoside phosphotransferase